MYHAQPMGTAGNGRATRQRGVQEIVQARGVVIHTNNLTNLRTYKLTNLQTYELTNLRTYIKSSRIPLRAPQSQISLQKTSQQTQVQHRNLRGRGTCRNAPKRPCQRQVHHRGGAPCKQLERVQGTEWRKRSIPTHSEWLYPLTFDAGKGLKEA